MYYNICPLLFFSGSLSADSLEKEKLISSYSEKMPLKAETGNSYCNCFFVFKIEFIYLKQFTSGHTHFKFFFNRRIIRSFNERQGNICRYFFCLYCCLYFDIYTSVIRFLSALGVAVRDWQLCIVLRDPQGQRRLWRRRPLLLLRLVLLLVEVAAGSPPPLPAAAWTAVWPHRAGWVSPARGFIGQLWLGLRVTISKMRSLQLQWGSREWPFPQPINSVLCF